MKFDVVIRNPPYQGTNKQQIYADFYIASRELGEVVGLSTDVMKDPSKYGLPPMQAKREKEDCAKYREFQRIA